MATLLGRAGGARAQVSARKTDACVLSPALTEGPFFVDEHLNRSDLTSGATGDGVTQGLPLQLVLSVSSAADVRCAPLAGVQIDIWQADALGRYSDVGSQRGQTYLRGYQLSDATGRVEFRTIYPGWYPGRTPHIHIKARIYDARGNQGYEYTTQLFFDETTNDTVMASAPYDRRGARDTRNAQDGIYNESLVASVGAHAGDSRGLVARLALGLGGVPATMAIKSEARGSRMA